MKIIDLLNKIANGEEVPKIIQHKGYIYEYKHRRDTENAFNYICNENGEYLSRRYYLDNILNDEVEILEEEKGIEKLKLDEEHCRLYKGNNLDEWWSIKAHQIFVYKLLNEIIDKLNSMDKE